MVVIDHERAPYANTHAFPAIWWNNAAIAYAVNPSITSTVDIPPPHHRDFALRVTDVRRSPTHIAFDATFFDYAPTHWTGQDWLLIPVDPSPGALPTRYAPDGFTLIGERWFAGQIGPGPGPTTRRFKFDLTAHHLALQTSDGSFVPLPASGDRLSPGTYALTVRLLNQHMQAAIIPVLHLTVAADGKTSFAVYPDHPAVAVNPCPERLRTTESCRRIAANG